MTTSTGPAVLDQYQKLVEAINESGQNIDSYYRKQNKILDEFDLHKLFSMIKPAVFNFIVLTTMTLKERRRVMNHPNLPLWLDGQDYLLETYDPANVKSHRLFSKRVFISLGSCIMNTFSFLTLE